MSAKRHSPACDRNRAPILEQLRRLMAAPGEVLEIGSGTGQHAVYFGAHLEHLRWQTSDLPEYHASIEAWLQEAALDNVMPPLHLDVLDKGWPRLYQPVDYVFSANTAHIMPWPAVEAMIHGVGTLLNRQGKFLLYGPFNYNGRYTSAGNERFDASLRVGRSHMGIRDFEAVSEQANAAGLRLEEDIEMPANNRLLAFSATLAESAD